MAKKGRSVMVVTCNEQILTGIMKNRRIHFNISDGKNQLKPVSAPVYI